MVYIRIITSICCSLVIESVYTMCIICNVGIQYIWMHELCDRGICMHLAVTEHMLTYVHAYKCTNPPLYPGACC